MSDTDKWKGAYLARINVGMGGGCWFRDFDKPKAIRGVILQLKSDWSHLFDIKKSIKEGKVIVNLYKDAGTSSWDDDEFLESIPYYGQ